MKNATTTTTAGPGSRPAASAPPRKPSRASAKSASAGVPDPYRDAVVRLATRHFRMSKGVERIYWFPDEARKEINFVEVNRAAVPPTLPNPAVLVFYLRPVLPNRYPLYLADVAPEEWERVRQGAMALPTGWDLSLAEVFERPASKSRKKGAS